MVSVEMSRGIWQPEDDEYERYGDKGSTKPKPESKPVLVTEGIVFSS